MAQDDDPRAPYKVFEVTNLKAHTQRALKRGDGNSNSKAKADGSEPARHFVIKDNLDHVVS